LSAFVAKNTSVLANVAKCCQKYEKIVKKLLLKTANYVIILPNGKDIAFF
jgi:hypothetical protein